VEGAGIPTSMSITSTTIVISQNANANNSSASLRICPWGNGDGSTTFNVPDHGYRTLVGRDNINNYPASRSSDFAGTHLSTTGGEEMHQLVTNEAVSVRSERLPHGPAGLASARSVTSECPLSGVKQTSQIRPAMSAYDPKRTSGTRLDEIAERN